MVIRYSIVIPVYNNPDDLSNCLESISRLNVDQKLLETIVVDNNSTDNTAAVAEKFPVRLVQEKRFQSSYAARNAGIQAARGKFIAFTDSDCVVDESWLSEIERETSDPTVGCFAGEILSATPETLVERFSDEIGLLRQRGPLSGWHFKPYAQTENAVYRKCVFDEIGLFDPTIKSGGDATIAWRMLDNTGYKVKFVPSAIVYHHHRTSVPELWKQFHRYGTGKVSWAVAQPDYTPPIIAKLESKIVAALEKAVASIQVQDGISEKEHIYPLLKAATQMAHLSGYMQDLLTTLSGGLPLDAVPARATELAPTCNICGSTAFAPGPNNRMVSVRGPQCAECGSLERHRALAGLFDAWPPESLACSSLVSFGEALPSGLSRRFASVRSAHPGEDDIDHCDIVVVPDFAALACGTSLPDMLGAIVEPLGDEGILLLMDRSGTQVEMLVEGESLKVTVGRQLTDLVAEYLPKVTVESRPVTDRVSTVDFQAITAMR